jgi:hypothetical protein
MVTIIDRTGEHREFEYDKRPYTFVYWDKGEKKIRPQLVLPLDVATWLFGEFRSAHYVHTTDGEYVRRYGVVDAPEDWVSTVGIDVLETTPLTRDTKRLGGWSADAGDPSRIQAVIDTKVNPSLKPRAGDYVNVGEPASSRIGS